MIQADSVLSTPPTNTSSIQEANPALEARAESVDSLCAQTATERRIEEGPPVTR